MRKVKHEPHFIGKVQNKRFEKEHGEWIFKATGDLSYFIETFDDAFNRDGEFIREISINKTLVTKRDNFQRDDNKGIVQIGYDFYLLPFGNIHVINQVLELTDILNGTFNKRFVVVHSEELYTIYPNSFGNRGFTSRKACWFKKETTIEMFQPYYNNEEEFKNREICAMGNSRFVATSSKRISIDDYTKNYNNALDKYPMHKKVIDNLYQLNSISLKWK